MGIERRRHPRFCKQLPVLAELPDGHCLVGITCDISREGARLCLDHRLPTGVHLMVALNPPGSTTPAEEIYTLWANVLHSRGEKMPRYELGIQYARPPEHYLQLIARLDGPAPTADRTGPGLDVI